MNRQTGFIFMISILITASLACGLGAPAAPPPATPDTQATVDAAIAATAQAGASLQATVDAAVAATAAAAPPTPTSAPANQYVSMTEEELQALIDQSVAEASAATQQTSTAATQSASDDTVTQEELDAMYAYYDEAYAALEYAEEVLVAYSDVYGELAAETLDLLQAVEEDLSGMSSSLNAINTTLIEISTSLNAGVALAEETITQLETAAQEAQTKATDAQAQAQEWSQSAQGKREERAQAALEVKPDNPPTDELSAVQSAFDYLDAVKSALGDNKISGDEMNKIAQLGANAAAGLQAFGGPKLQGFSLNINEITAQLARGQNRGARESMGAFEKSLGGAGFNARPGRKP